jgi:hypothetical protein
LKIGCEGGLFEQPERERDARRFTLMDDYAQDAFNMRAIAAQLRVHAAETDQAIFRRKFEGMACDLEEAAVDAESRAQPKDDFKRVS